MEDRLQKLAAIVDYSGFTRAAAELHISQPALSAAIKKLERELGVSLIERNNQRGITLTEAGKLAYATSKQLANTARTLSEQLTTLNAAKTPLALGMIDSIADALLVQAHELKELEMWAHVSLSVNSSTVLIQDVVQHKLDAAMIATRNTLPKLLQATRLGAEPLVIVTHASRRIPMLAAIQAGTLPDFLSYNVGSTTEQLVTRAASDANITLEPSFFSTSPEIMLELLLAGRGTAALPFLMVRQYLRDYTLSVIPLNKKQRIIERPILAIQDKTRTLPAAFDATLKRTANQLKRLEQEARTAVY